MTVRKITLTAMLTGIALIIFIIEAQIPLPVKIPGIKLGLSNIITLVAMVLLGKKEAFSVLIMRIVIGSIFSGGISSLIYSLSGGLCCFAVMCAALKIFGNELIWAVSACGAMAHNFAQLAAANVIMGNLAVFAYMPYLAVSGIVTGIFTGLCAYYVLKNGYIKKLTEK